MERVYKLLNWRYFKKNKCSLDIWDFYSLRKVAMLEIIQKGLFIKVSLDSNPSFGFGQSNVTVCHISSVLFCLLPASPLLGSPLGRSRHSSSQSDLTAPPSNSSGLSFTACMSDFSLYVFHPYGAGKQKSAVTGLPPGPGPLGMERKNGNLVVIF